ncbi:transglutaminase domain-containing protein [Candidatus Woesearchaeota archaeon]|nr:transglutaminase domain-containing protein [Candidatus Woesearchaeota archaeon]
MKKIPLLIFLITFILSTPLALAEENNLYLYDSLELYLNVNGEFDLKKEGNSPSLKDVTAQLLLFPQESYRQKLLNIDTEGQTKEDQVNFVWNDQKIEEKEFGYSATIKTNNQRTEVKTKIPFPLKGIDDYKEYLLPTITIDSDNQKIIQKATELVEGEDDAFKVAFKLASWVEENVVYDLTTLNAETSQKASWVLDNKNGVCDEMTSLFIAMSRAVGIPARFVSGISYTTSELFNENWQPHGWAEVYFPEIGWVDFDITFGEYGYIDVTHIKLRDGFDPAEAATKYEWLANDVSLEAKELGFAVNLKKQGNHEKEMILLEQEILAKEVDFGSYNLIKGIMKNSANYYAATTLQLAVPKELEVLGRNKRTILLSPNEVRETFWIIKVTDDLNQNSWYQFPTLIYSEKNVTIRDSFKAQVGNNFYSKDEIEELTVKDEEKTYSRKISFTCNYPKELKLNQEAEVKCNLKNSGNTNLNNVNFCLDKICEIINLPINQEKSTNLTIKGEIVGWNKIIISAENDEIEKKSSLEYVVLDEPAMEIKTTLPEKITYGENFQIIINLEKSSFSIPKEIIVTVKGLGTENKWEISELKEKEELILDFTGGRTNNKNKFKIITSWKDKNGESYSHQQEVMIIGEADNFADKIKMFLNNIASWFY